MITQKTFAEVRRRYGHFASWAVWAPVGATPKSNIDDITVLDPDRNPELLEVLHTRFVLLGLNISRPLQGPPFGNFHDPSPGSTDYRLRAALHGTPCWGGYMTDIIKDFEQKSAGRMMQYLRKNRDFEQEQIRSLCEELAVVGCIKPTLVALGRDAEAILKRNMATDFRIVGVPHYAAYIKLSVYRAKVAERLF